MRMFRKPAPFRIVLTGERPRGALGGSLSHYVPPGAQYDYKPPSVFVRYKWLTLIFLAMILALLAYPLLTPQKARPAARGSSRASEPVYVEPLEPVKR